MSSPKIPQIRPYVRGQDDKLVRFTIGRACVDSLATANNRGTFATLQLPMSSGSQECSLYTPHHTICVVCALMHPHNIPGVVAAIWFVALDMAQACPNFCSVGCANNVRH